jgi:transcriptional regulator with XRE-family HTH domain
LITSDQIRAARALLRWSSAELAERSGVGSATIKRMESMNGVPSGNVKTLLALKNALETAGVEFLGSPDNAPGVCLMRVEKNAVKRSGKDGS